MSRSLGLDGLVLEVNHWIGSGKAGLDQGAVQMGSDSDPLGLKAVASFLGH